MPPPSAAVIAFWPEVTAPASIACSARASASTAAPAARRPGKAASAPAAPPRRSNTCSCTAWGARFRRLTIEIDGHGVAAAHHDAHPLARSQFILPREKRGECRRPPRLRDEAYLVP